MFKFSQPTISGLIYPESEVLRMVEDIKTRIENETVWVTVDTPEDGAIHLQRVAGKLTEVFVEDGYVMVEYEVMQKTGMGVIIETLLNSRIKLDIKPAMTGIVGTDKTVSDLKFIQAYFATPEAKPRRTD